MNTTEPFPKAFLDRRRFESASVEALLQPQHQ